MSINQKQKRILITFKEEIADHDGYCSGNENEYTCRTYTKEVKDSDLCYADEINDISCRRGQSYYCKMSKEACEADLGPHEVRITVVNAEIIGDEK